MIQERKNVTCSVQATYLTGKMPTEHGIVANGWYFRDECEMLKIGLKLLKKQVGFRYLMDVIPIEASLVRGSHGCVPNSDEDGPLFITGQTHLLPEQPIQAVDVCQLILEHLNV